MLGWPAEGGDRAAGIVRHFGLDFVQLAKGLFSSRHFTVLRFLPTHKAIILRAIEANANRMFRRKRLRHLPSQIDRHGWITSGARIVEIASQPAGTLDSFG